MNQLVALIHCCESGWPVVSWLLRLFRSSIELVAFEWNVFPWMTVFAQFLQNRVNLIFIPLSSTVGKCGIHIVASSPMTVRRVAAWTASDFSLSPAARAWLFLAELNFLHFSAASWSCIFRGAGGSKLNPVVQVGPVPTATKCIVKGFIIITTFMSTSLGLSTWLGNGVWTAWCWDKSHSFPSDNWAPKAQACGGAENFEI